MLMVLIVVNDLEVSSAICKSGFVSFWRQHLQKCMHILGSSSTDSRTKVHLAVLTQWPDARSEPH